LIFRDGAEYIAHALEFDLVASGKSESESKKRLIETITAHLSFIFAKGMWDNALKDAPQEFFERWEVAHKKEMLQLIGEMVKRPVSNKRLKEKAESFDLKRLNLVAG
jgi:hypothetical protein